MRLMPKFTIPVAKGNAAAADGSLAALIWQGGGCDRHRSGRPACVQHAARGRGQDQRGDLEHQRDHDHHPLKGKLIVDQPG